jgi:hypothetical protein
MKSVLNFTLIAAMGMASAIFAIFTIRSGLRIDVVSVVVPSVSTGVSVLMAGLFMSRLLPQLIQDGDGGWSYVSASLLLVVAAHLLFGFVCSVVLLGFGVEAFGQVSLGEMFGRSVFSFVLCYLSLPLAVVLGALFGCLKSN